MHTNTAICTINVSYRKQEIPAISEITLNSSLGVVTSLLKSGMGYGNRVATSMVMNSPAMQSVRKSARL